MIKYSFDGYNELFFNELPRMTAVDFKAKYFPNYPIESIYRMARKLGIKPAKYSPTITHRSKTSVGLKKKFTEEQIEYVKNNLNRDSRGAIARYLCTSIPVLNRLIKDLGLVIDKAAMKEFHRVRSAEHIHLAVAGFHKKFKNDPEFRNYILNTAKEASIQLWKDEKYRFKVKRGIELRYRNSDLRSKLSKLSKERYDSDPNVKAALRSLKPECDSKLNIDVAAVLDGYGIEYEREFEISNYRFDFRIGNILLEVNGDYWHSLPHNIKNDNAKASIINKYFPNYQIRVIWESEFRSIRGRNRLLEILGLENLPATHIELSDLTFNTSVNKDIARKMLMSFHYIGYTSRISKIYGLEYCEIPIAIAGFGSPIRQNITGKKALELVRLCRHPRFHNKNMLSRLLSLCIKDLRSNGIELLISYVDSRLHDGAVYKASNWIYRGLCDSDYEYQSDHNIPMHKKTLYNRAIAEGLTEKEYALKYRFRKVSTGQKHKYEFLLQE